DPDHPSNAGCDMDPRTSTPMHLGDDLVAEVLKHPHVVAWVAGHSHVNDVAFYGKRNKGVWVVRTSAEADFAHQDRLLQLMDTRPLPRRTSEAVNLPNGLQLHKLALPGTRAVTVLVAFEAGARTERPEENGMAHFLEHLVFKGGEKYDDYRKVNETAERIGGVLNAYTSHDLVAFHITCRAEVVPRAIDLLTDFVGRPKIDAAELDRERGVVIQEIAR